MFVTRADIEHSPANWEWGKVVFVALNKLRSKQAPGSVFHPRDESGKIDCEILGPFWFNIKVDNER